MLSKNKIKLIQSLASRKQRDETHLFVVEGTKSVEELLRSKIQVKSLFATSGWISGHEVIPQPDVKITEVSSDDLSRISFMKTPQEVLAIAHIPEPETPEVHPNGLVLALDTIQDPGNMGTLIRIADWYGIQQIVCSEECADLYNPKVIQATMGSFTRVSVVRTELKSYLKQLQISVYGALLDGVSLYETQFPNAAVMLMGNEGSGIRPELLECITHRVTIPRRGGAESLNVGVATAILCDAWARGIGQ